MLHVLNLWINRKETSLTRFWYCTSCTPPLQQHCTRQSWTSFKAVWPPWATHTHTHTPVPSCKLVSWTVGEENFFQQRNREDQRLIMDQYKTAGWGIYFPFPSPNHVLSSWLGAPQPQTGRGEEHGRRRTKIEPHRYWHTNRAQKSQDKMRGMIWYQLDGHLFGEFCGVDVEAGQVEGRRKGRS